MASCYICGTYLFQGEGYRRTVQTGSGTRFHFGKRMSSSYGVYYGTRTVCKNCAEEIDRRNRIATVILGIVGIAILIIVLIIASSPDKRTEQLKTNTNTTSEYKNSPRFNIIGEKADVYRKPSIKSTVITTISSGSNIRKTGETAYFFKVQFELNGVTTEGYIRKKDISYY